MFKSYRFAFAATVDKALARLDAAVVASPGFGLTVDAAGRVKIFRAQSPVLLNGFFPVFVGRFGVTNTGSELRGGFRFNLLAIALFAGFVGVSAVSLVNVLMSTDVPVGMAADWKWQRVRFELQFIAFAVLAALFAWLAGKPIRERIKSIIADASTRQTTPANRQ